MALNKLTIAINLNFFMTEVPILWKQDSHTVQHRNQSIDLLSPLIFSANQWIGFYVIGTSVIKELRKTLSEYSKYIAAFNCNLLRNV